MTWETLDRDTSLSDTYAFNIPPHRSDVLKRSFIYNGNIIWNNLPHEIRMLTNVGDFRWRYKRYKCFILDPLFENGRCPLYARWVITLLFVYIHSIMISLSWIIYMFVCPQLFFLLYCVMYRITSWNCVTGQHGDCFIVEQCYPV